jgi:hypothetical protein
MVDPAQGYQVLGKVSLGAAPTLGAALSLRA